MPSELENAMARFRRQLLQQERAAASQMVRAYGESWARIRVDLLRVQGQLAAGDTTPWRIMQDARLKSVQAQIEAELRRFAPYAAQSAIQMQQAAIEAATRNAGHAIEAAGGPQVTLRFDKLNAGAVETLVGYASDGSPLRALFDAIGPQVAPRMTATLAQGIALGWNPRVTARQMRTAYGMGLNRALLISRTETLRAYRGATEQVYQRNADILEGWIWVCACDRRSCASCWAMHGSLHALDERLDDHPNGRCAMAPKVRDRPNRIGATGEERFAALSADDQRAVLGPGMYEAWKDGQVSLSPHAANSIVGRRNDAQWGSMRHARSLRDMVGPEAAQMYSARAAGKGAPAPVRAAPVAARVMGPAGEKVSGHITGIPTKGAYGETMNEVVRAIDSVHGDGPLVDVPFKKSAGTTTMGEYGFTPRGTPLHIKVSTAAQEPANTFAHEIGHYIDGQQIHISDNIVHSRIRGTPMPPHLAAWKDAVDNSKPVQRLKDLGSGKVPLAIGESGKLLADKKYTSYLLQYNEMWARSYAQYVSVRSGNESLLTDLRRAQSDRHYPRQWEDDDFKPIAEAFDGIFEAMGWRK